MEKLLQRASTPRRTRIGANEACHLIVRMYAGVWKRGRTTARQCADSRLVEIAHSAPAHGQAIVK